MSCTLPDIQKAQCDILKEVARVCEKHNIKYFLAQGTLLGAVRHKGFIPWDDDIDTAMLREDYEKIAEAVEIFPSESNNKDYFITNHHIEKHYMLTWTKIRSVNTLSRPKRYKNIPVNWGICIDLFPILPISNNSFVRKCEIVFFKVSRKMLMAEMTKFEENHNAITRLLEKVPLCIRHFFADLSIKIFNMHKNSEYVFAVCKGAKVIKRDIIFGTEQRLTFEDRDYPAPSDYHAYLTEMYGDYMTPPPESERGGHFI